MLQPHQQSLRLYLIISIIVLLSAGTLFALIAENVVSAGALTITDVNLAQWLHERSTPLLTHFLLVVTHLHDPLVLSSFAALIAIYFMWKQRWYAMWAVVLGVEGGMLLNLLAKQVFHRARPSFDHPLVTLTTYSFPSGHVVASTVFYGVLAALLISQAHSWRRTFCILLIAFCLVVLVAFSRMYLGAHYLSDVLAAFLEGIAWLALCFTVIQNYRLLR
ncbi:phosphatase PAP2 family protein [Methylophilus flavus]|uniref:Phosphatase PAP2 family protein n=1 Tax=Methylophilus flavus TaxID=640084 RepID=A0ABW3PAP6_9PROT